MKTGARRMNTRSCIKQRKDSRRQAALGGREFKRSSSWHRGLAERSLDQETMDQHWVWMEHGRTRT